MRSPIFMRSILAAGLSSGWGALAAAGCDSFELPDPPDVSGIVASYEQPSGRLDRQSAAAIANALVERSDRTRERVPLELTEELVADVEDVGQDPTDFGEETGVQKVQGIRIDLAAVSRLHHSCGGWHENPGEPGSSGTVELTMAIDRAGIIPTLWGYFERCRVQRGDVSLELDGDLALHFGVDQPRLQLGELRHVAYLVSFDGTLVASRGDGGATVDSHFSFRVLQSREVQLSVNLPDGTNVVGVFDPAVLRPSHRESTLRAGVLTRDQRWNCDLDGDRGSCTNEANPAEVVKW